jgi:hypothetical protein
MHDHHHWLHSPVCTPGLLQRLHLVFSLHSRIPPVRHAQGPAGSFSFRGVVSPTLNPQQSWRPNISVRVVSLSWLVTILKWRELGFRRKKTLPRRHDVGISCVGLGGHNWHCLSFDSTHPLARYAPSWPRTTLLTPPP